MSLFRRLKDVKITSDDCNYTALAFSAMRRTVPPGMAELLRDNGDYEDLLQDARLGWLFLLSTVYRVYCLPVQAPR